jgi:uncharacterized membrane protein YdjX (TVP38/TMEM64 family)
VLRNLLADRKVRRFGIFLALVAVTAAVALMRIHGNVPMTPDGVRDAIRSWGSMAPLIFAGAFVFRPFIFFPSTLLFLAGGLAFGAGWGTFYAAVGGTLGAMIGFLIARILGYEFVRAQLGDRLPDVQHKPWGVGAVFLLNLIPVAPMTIINYGAGLSGMDLVPFTAAVIAGLTPRAFAYSFFGSSLLHVRSKEFAWAVALLVALLLVPLYVRRFLSRRTERLDLPPVA